jgi:hypothetical protein
LIFPDRPVKMAIPAASSSGLALEPTLPVASLSTPIRMSVSAAWTPAPPEEAAPVFGTTYTALPPDSTTRKFLHRPKAGSMLS